MAPLRSTWLLHPEEMKGNNDRKAEVMGNDARRQTRLKVMKNTLAVVAFFCFLLKAAAAKTPSQECELVFKERLACWWKPCLTKQGLATSGQ